MRRPRREVGVVVSPWSTSCTSMWSSDDIGASQGARWRALLALSLTWPSLPGVREIVGLADMGDPLVKDSLLRVNGPRSVPTSADSALGQP